MEPPVYAEVDTGYETPCWISTRSIPSRVEYWRETVGPREPRTVYMHLCERYGEINLCIRPDHIKIASYSENNQHSKALQRAAGVVITWSDESRARLSAAMTGKKRSPETQAKISATLRGRTRGPMSQEQRAKISSTMTGRRLTAEHRQNIGAANRHRHERGTTCG